MATRLDPYLSFRDETREAMEFYRGVFGGTLTLNTFADFHASPDHSEDDKIMHAILEVPSGI
ncbi:MAG: VOC family protein, partial [Solirubrobacterales bacterium]